MWHFPQSAEHLHEARARDKKASQSKGMLDFAAEADTSDIRPGY
jgi:hypothetical protein